MVSRLISYCTKLISATINCLLQHWCCSILASFKMLQNCDICKHSRLHTEAHHTSDFHEREFLLTFLLCMCWNQNIYSVALDVIDLGKCRPEFSGSVLVANFELHCVNFPSLLFLRYTRIKMYEAIYFVRY